jgi:hypothetical protein
MKPKDLDGQATKTVLVSVNVMVSLGSTNGVSIGATMLQKPPLSLKTPPLRSPASGWPIEPLRLYGPPLLVPLELESHHSIV